MKRWMTVSILSFMAALVLSSCGMNVNVTLNENAAHIEIEADQETIRVMSAVAEDLAAKAAEAEAAETAEARMAASGTLNWTSNSGAPVRSMPKKTVGTALGTPIAVSSARMVYTAENTDVTADTEAAVVTEVTEPVMHQHAFVEAGRTPSTCVTAGCVVYACACGETVTEALPLTEHTPVEVVAKQATCQTTGIINTACSVCGLVFSSVETPITGHIPGNWVTTVAPTTTSEGVTAQFCTCCGEKLAESWVAPIPAVDAGAYCQQVLALINANRVAVGLPALGWSQAAANAAAIRSQESTTVFDHVRPDGRAWYTILDETGVPYMTAGENLAAGQMSPEAVVAAWMNSPDHFANIMNPNFAQMGVGLTVCGGYGLYWVQIFTN